MILIVDSGNKNSTNIMGHELSLGEVAKILFSFRFDDDNLRAIVAVYVEYCRAVDKLYCSHNPFGFEK